MRNLKYIGLGLLLCMVWAFSNTVFLTFLNHQGFIQNSSIDWYYVFFACIWAPFWEELFFRWAPIQLAIRIDRRKYLLPLVVLSSVFFGMHHGATLQEGVFLQGVLGLILSYVYIKTKNIWCSMLVHSLYNTSLVLATIYFGS